MAVNSGLDPMKANYAVNEILEEWMKYLRIRYPESIQESKSVSGSQPEETYRPATKKNMYLDRPTSHGGWPDGPSKSFTSNEPVNKQIYDWLKTMGLIKE